MSNFNSLSSYHKTPAGPLRTNESLFLRISIPTYYNPEDVKVIFYEYCSNSEPIIKSMIYEREESDNVLYSISISSLPINIYQYCFSFYTYGQIKFIKMKNNSWEGNIVDYIDTNNWQLTVYKPTETHYNMNGGIMYQIFPDRFYKGKINNDLPNDRIYRNWGELPYFDDETIGKDFFGGNLDGISEKLKYLRKLNVSVLYLNPIWESQSNHRYDTGNYQKVDPVLGTMENLKNFITKAHSFGMIVILDTVLNHTGSDSIYFNKYNRYPNEGAYNSPNSMFYNWYYFHGSKDDYESWWGFKNLPKLNQNNPDFINYFFGLGGIIDQWYSLGIDGLRIDVADELSNETLTKIYNASERNCNSIVIIGEVWDNASNKCNYGHRMNYFLGNELTSVMNYPVKDALLSYFEHPSKSSADTLKNTLLSIFVEDYPYEVSHSLMNFLSTHDTVRAITKLASEECSSHDKKEMAKRDTLSSKKYKEARNLLLLSYIVLYFLPGIPSIFYGDEIGISGQRDPFCRKCFTWDHIDKKIYKLIYRLGNFRKSISDFLSVANFDVVEITEEVCVLVRFYKDRFIFLFVNTMSSDLYIDTDKIISRYLNIPYLKNTNILLCHGRNITEKYISPFGAEIIEYHLRD